MSTQITSAPYAPRIGSVDFIPNLVAGLLNLSSPAALPVGKGLSASAPPPKEKQPRIDTYPNYLALGVLLSNKFPFSAPIVFDPPKTKYEVQSDFYPVSYAPAQVAGTTTQPPLVMPTPTLKRQVFVEPIPNILLKGIPAPAILPIAKNQDFSQLQLKYNVYDQNVLWANRELPAAIPVSQALPQGKQLDIAFNNRKYDVYDINYLWWSSQLPDTIPIGLTIPNVVGMASATAATTISSLGFIPVSTTATSTTVPAGFVISQIPVGGTPALAGTIVNYVVSSGPPVTPSAPTGLYVGRIITEPKRVGETALLQPPFDFISTLAVGETILTAVVTATVWSGVDPNPSAIISGAAQISGTKVNQTLTGGVVGTIYELACVITTSQSHSYKQTTYFAVKPDLV